MTKHFPNASIHPTHSIENGELVPKMGTFYCCLLEFKENSTYGFNSNAILGVLISITDDMNISLYSHSLSINPSDPNHYATLLRALRLKESHNNYYFNGIYDKSKIVELSQPQILDCINEIKQDN